MTSAHQLATIGAAIAGIACVVVGLAGMLGWWRRRLVDRFILVSLGFLVLSLVTGVLVWLLVRPPRDPLHLVYAAAAVLALPVARYLARNVSPLRRAAAITSGGVILLVVLARLAMTG